MYQEVLQALGLSSYQPIDETPDPSAPAVRPPNIKGFFANERTFLSWLNFSLVLGGLSIALINFTDSQRGLISASTFATVSLVLMAFSYYKFRWRAAKLHNREFGHYDDLITPTVLVIAVILAVILNFWVNYMAQLL